MNRRRLVRLVGLGRVGLISVRADRRVCCPASLRDWANVTYQCRAKLRVRGRKWTYMILSYLHLLCLLHPELLRFESRREYRVYDHRVLGVLRMFLYISQGEVRKIEAWAYIRRRA